MTQDEFNDIAKVFDGLKNPEDILKGLHEIINLLNETKTILSFYDNLKWIKKLEEKIESENWIMKDHFTVSEVAEYTSFTRSHVYKMVREREIPVYKLDKIVYIKKSDLLNYINHYDRRLHHTHKYAKFDAEKLLQHMKAIRHEAKSL